MKNCDPLVFFPELAIDRTPGLSWVSSGWPPRRAGKRKGTCECDICIVPWLLECTRQQEKGTHVVPTTRTLYICIHAYASRNH